MKQARRLAGKGVHPGRSVCTGGTPISTCKCNEMKRRVGGTGVEKQSCGSGL